MALRTLNELINAFSISISILDFDQSLALDQQKLNDRSQSATDLDQQSIAASLFKS
jgi:hypothetical protein